MGDMPAMPEISPVNSGKPIIYFMCVLGINRLPELLHCILDRHLAKIRAGAVLPQVKNLADAVFDMNNLVFILVPHGGIQFRKRE